MSEPQFDHRKKLFKIPDDDYKAVETYAQANDIDILQITYVSEDYLAPEGTNRYILHLQDCDETVEVTDGHAVMTDSSKDWAPEDLWGFEGPDEEDEFGLGGDWWKNRLA